MKINEFFDKVKDEIKAKKTHFLLVGHGNSWKGFLAQEAVSQGKKEAPDNDEAVVGQCSFAGNKFHFFVDTHLGDAKKNIRLALTAAGLQYGNTEVKESSKEEAEEETTEATLPQPGAGKPLVHTETQDVHLSADAINRMVDDLASQLEKLRLQIERWKNHPVRAPQIFTVHQEIAKRLANHKTQALGVHELNEVAKLFQKLKVLLTESPGGDGSDTAPEPLGAAVALKSRTARVIHAQMVSSPAALAQQVQLLGGANQRSDQALTNLANDAQQVRSLAGTFSRTLKQIADKAAAIGTAYAAIKQKDQELANQGKAPLPAEKSTELVLKMINEGVDLCDKYMKDNPKEGQRRDPKFVATEDMKKKLLAIQQDLLSFENAMSRIVGKLKSHNGALPVDRAGVQAKLDSTNPTGMPSIDDVNLLVELVKNGNLAPGRKAEVEQLLSGPGGVLAQLVGTGDVQVIQAAVQACPADYHDELVRHLIDQFGDQNDLFQSITDHFLVEEFKGSPDTWLRANSIVGKVMAQMGKQQLATFRSATLRRGMAPLLELPLEDQGAEVDEFRMKRTIRGQNGKDESVNVPAEERARLVAENKQLHERLAGDFVDALTGDDSFNAIPDQAKAMCATIYNEVMKVRSKPTDGPAEQAAHERSALTQIGAFIMLRVVNPALTEESARLLKEAGDNAEKRAKVLKLQRALILQTKIYQNLANGVEFGDKEPAMTIFNEFLDDNREKMDDFFRKLAGVG